ncbi:MAG TPA: ABC-2 family transporter protein, partial [Verrucomicrobiae bacterium]
MKRRCCNIADAAAALHIRRALKKYLHVVNIGIQNQLVYRVNYLARVLFGFVPLMATIFLWRAVYASKDTGSDVGGYSLAAMTSYYVLVTIVDSLTAVSEDDWLIAADIKDGNISQFLLKPIDYLTYRLSLFCAGRLIYTGVALLPVAGFVFYLREFFVLPADAATLGWFAVSVVLAALLTFLISYTMALLAFWVTEVAT